MTRIKALFSALSVAALLPVLEEAAQWKIFSKYRSTRLTRRWCRLRMDMGGVSL